MALPVSSARAPGHTATADDDTVLVAAVVTAGAVWSRRSKFFPTGNGKHDCSPHHDHPAAADGSGPADPASGHNARHPLRDRDHATSDRGATFQIDWEVLSSTLGTRRGSHGVNPPVSSTTRPPFSRVRQFIQRDVHVPVGAAGFVVRPRPSSTAELDRDGG